MYKKLICSGIVFSLLSAPLASQAQVNTSEKETAQNIVRVMTPYLGVWAADEMMDMFDGCSFDNKENSQSGIFITITKEGAIRIEDSQHQEGNTVGAVVDVNEGVGGHVNALTVNLKADSPSVFGDYLTYTIDLNESGDSAYINKEPFHKCNP
jgi:hypothetical protein